MITEISRKIYDRCITPSEWRYSAAIVGLARYLKFHKLPYLINGRKMYYCSSDVKASEENLRRYYDYVDFTYSEYFPHSVLLKKIEEGGSEAKELKKIRYLKTLLKDFDWEGASVLKKLKLAIKKHRNSIIEMCYVKPYTDCPLGYSNYNQASCFRKEKLKSCRVLDYYFDAVRKNKSAGYKFNAKSYVFEDCIEFDYIPFGFTYGLSSCIINCNYNIKKLIDVNNRINSFLRNNNRKNYEAIFQEVAGVIPCPVEIVERTSGGRYSSFMYRKEAKEIFQYMRKNGLAHMDFEINAKFETIKVSSECVRNVMNLVDLDALIFKMLRLNIYTKDVYKLIKINTKMYASMGRIQPGVDVSAYLGPTDKIFEALVKTNTSLAGAISLKRRLLGYLDDNESEKFLEEILKLSSRSGVLFEFLAYFISGKVFADNRNIAFAIIEKIGYWSYQKGIKDEE